MSDRLDERRSSSACIAGYDGSDASLAAVRFAQAVAGAMRGELLVATVYGSMPYSLGRRSVPSGDAERVEAMRAHAKERLDGVDAEGARTLAIAARSPAEGLHDLAERERAMLLAVGATHRRGLGRVVPGSVGERLLHGAPCPVAVVPASWSGALRHLAVAYDPRRESEPALASAAALATRLGARLTVISVYDAALYLWLTGPDSSAAPWDIPELREDFDREIERAAADLPPQLEVQTRILSGLPGDAIVEAVKDGVDLVVLGSRGYGPIGSVLAGSVSRFVVDRAPCPVLVTPRGATLQ